MDAKVTPRKKSLIFSEFLHSLANALQGKQKMQKHVQEGKCPFQRSPSPPSKCAQGQNRTWNSRLRRKISESQKFLPQERNMPKVKNFKAREYLAKRGFSLSKNFGQDKIPQTWKKWSVDGKISFRTQSVRENIEIFLQDKNLSRKIFSLKISRHSRNLQKWKRLLKFFQGKKIFRNVFCELGMERFL